MRSWVKATSNFLSRKSVFVVLAFASTLLLSLLLANADGLRNRRQVLFVDAARAGNVTSMRILLALGAKIDEPECPYNRCVNAIIAGAWNGHRDAVQFLLDKGANVNARLKRGQTALMVASYHGYKDTVSLLLANGADTCLDSNGETALMWAERNRHSEVAELLRKAPCERAKS
jgi:ankyrin repeat protein